MEHNEDRIIRTDYSEIMQKNYIDYAMSVIVSRALPDVRDGLKPVQRRVLYDMWELGTRHDRPYRKSARIVGDTMGKYHPHGDSSIYDSLVVMAQDFKKGQVLVDGHGNFGSIEGDGAAAMRYTEARLMKFTEDVFLKDLDKDIIDFMPNFDENEQEPTVLPARLPNVLLNGSEGIAVGMATSIPPHNLGEIIDATCAFIKNGDISDSELFGLIKGPDFPTGGIVVNADDLPEIYSTGSGRIRVRGRVEIEDLKGGKKNIVVTEIPYTMTGSGIGKFMSDVAALADGRVLQDVTDISNQSSKEGIRIVIELRKGADVEYVRDILYKKTRLEDTFGMNMLVVSGGRPETMSLKQIIESSVDFQFEIADRKYTWLLEKELNEKEIQEGLIRACDVIDLIIEILRGSANRKMATECLVMGKTEGIKFKSAKSRKAAADLMFTERQANAILDMRLVKLIGLEIEALMKSHEETLRKIEEYRRLLDDHDAMADLIISELQGMKKEFGKPRRTAIENAEEIVLREVEEVEEEVAFCLDRFGYARIIEKSTYDKNLEAVAEESRYHFPVLSTDRICIFTDKGRLHTIKVSDIPRRKLRQKGTPIDNVSTFSNKDEDILLAAAQSEVAAGEVFFATKDGFVKRAPGAEFVSAVRNAAATKLKDGDSVVFVGLSGDMETAVLATKGGYLLRFPLSDVPEFKKTAAGVKGITLASGDIVKNAFLLAGGHEFSADVSGGKVLLSRMRTAKRGGKGTKH